MKAFYLRLKEIRKEKRLTQEELAERADISRVMVSRYETGTVIPTVDVLVSLADALDVTTDYLLGRCDHSSSCSSSSEFSAAENSHTDLPKDKAELRRFVLDILKESIHLNF